MGKHSSWNEVIAHAAWRLACGRAKQLVNNHHRLSQRNWGKLHTRCHVAHRVDMRHACLILLVNFDSSRCSDFNTHRTQPKTAGVCYAACGVQHGVYRQTFTIALDLDMQAVRGFGNGLHFGFKFEVDAGLGHLHSNKAAHVFVKTCQHLVAPMYLGHVRA